MLSAQATKTVYYLRVRRDGQAFDLQLIVNRARERKGTCDATEVELGDGDVVRIQHYSTSNGRTLLHLTRYVPGVQAATLQPRATTAEDEEGTQSPPRGKEFKDGDCFLLIKEHHVLYCAHGISKSKASLYLSQLFRGAELHDESSGFELAPASNLDKLQLIRDHGVKSIQLGVTAFDLSLPMDHPASWYGRIFASIGDQLSALIHKEQDPIAQKALEDLTVNVEINLDGNTRAIQSSQDLIESFASTVLDGDLEGPISQFTIVTQKKERITAGDVRLQTSVRVEAKDNSVSHISVWSAMEAYFDQITQGSLLEQ